VADKGWVLAGDLRPGDRLVQADGAYATLASSGYEPHPEGVPIFNFEVEDSHTYFVSQTTSDEPVLVHNASKKPCRRDPCKRMGLNSVIRRLSSWTPIRRRLSTRRTEDFYRSRTWPWLPPTPLPPRPWITFRKVSLMTALLPLRGWGTYTNPAATAVVRYFGRRRNDVAGHIIARQFGGKGHWWAANGNLFPQDRATNHGGGQYWRLERSIEGTVRARRRRVCVQIRFFYRGDSVYPAAQTARPFRGTYRRWISGRELRTPFARFGNP
jgi:hypothetical protein